MGIEFAIVNRTLVAALAGELDHTQAERLRGQIDAAYNKSSCKHIIFEMSRVSFMDSSGIGMVIGRYKNAEKRGGRLALANMDSGIERLFEISGLSKIALRAKSLEAAHAALGGNHSE